MFEPVQPVPAAPPSTSGLVRSAQTPTDGGRWQNGIAWRSERCPQARTYDPCDTGFDTPVGEGGDGLHYYRPVAFRVEDECYTRTQVDEGRVRRQALAVTSYMMARELHDGARTRVSPYVTPDSGGAADQVNPYLAQDTSTVVAGTWDPLQAMGVLEEAVRDATLGMDPFIHVPVSFVPLIDGALRRDGQMLFTKTGATVVADAGYPGTGPLQDATAEIQTVTITGTPTGGTFTLTAEGQTTAAIAYNAAAATVQTALNNLSTVDGATVTGSAGGPYSVTFPAVEGNVPQMTASGAGLTGGTAPAVNVTTATPGVDVTPSAGNWIYATGPVQVRLGDVITETIRDWPSNRVLMVADRLFAATFDPCTLHAIRITDIEPSA